MSTDIATFKTQQVLRVERINQSAEDGTRLPKGVRVVVMSTPEEGKTKVKVQDPAHPSLWDARAVLKNEVFATTQRGRPPLNRDEGEAEAA